MSRFTDVPKPGASIPESVSLYPDWDAPEARARAFDDTMIVLGGRARSTRGSPATSPSIRRGAKRDMTEPKWLLVTHMFNHQTHHRGQVHCMLTQAGGKPHTTDSARCLPE